MKAIALACLALLSLSTFAQDHCEPFRTTHPLPAGESQTVTLCSGQFLEIVNNTGACSFTLDSATLPVDLYRAATREFIEVRKATLPCGLAENFAIHNTAKLSNTVRITWNSSAEQDRAEAKDDEEIRSQGAPDSSHIQTIALKAGHSEQIFNTNHVVTFHVTTDFPVTIREHGCLKQDVMDAIFTCRFASDIFIYDQRPILSFGAEPNVVTIDWTPNT